MKKRHRASDREQERVAFLHSLFLRIQERIANGSTLKSAIAWAARRRRSRLFCRGMLGKSSLVYYYYVWRRNPVPEVFRRHFKAPERRLPFHLVLEWVNRLDGDRIISAAAALRSLRLSWERGESLPGIGTWREFVRRERGQRAADRTMPPRWPFGKSVFYAYLGDGGRGAWHRRLTAALRAQQELQRFEDFIAARRADLERRIAHEPIGSLCKEATRFQQT